MHQTTDKSTKPEPAGLVIHGAARYDFLVWLFTLGGERRLRAKMLALAQLRSGEDVLDIGCGTGTLAILAKRAVGEGGVVHAIDAAPEMIERAREKARRAGVDLALAACPVQALPLPDRSVDVVLSTLMLHHLPRQARPAIVAEIKRILRPGGRFLAVDFVKPAGGGKSFMDRFHRHGFVRLDDVVDELWDASLTIVRTGPLGEMSLHFVLAADGPEAARALAESAHLREGGAGARSRRRRGGLALAVVVTLGVLGVIALHVGAVVSLRPVLPDSRVLAYALAVVALLVVGKLALLGRGHGARLVKRWVGAREEHLGDV